jgi:hypothetical protein
MNLIAHINRYDGQPRAREVRLSLEDWVGELRLLYIVYWCAAKDVYFSGTRPLRECPRR